MKSFLMLDSNVCNRLRKNENGALDNFLIKYPGQSYTSITEDYAYYEYLGIKVPSPNIVLKDIDLDKVILNEQEKKSKALLPEQYFNESSSLKGAARYYYSDEISEKFIEDKFNDCLKYCDNSFINCYLYQEVFQERRSSRSIASNLRELLASDYVNSYTMYSIKEHEELSLYYGLLGMAYEIVIEQRNVHLLRLLKKFWNNRDLELQNKGSVSDIIVSDINNGIKRIKSRQDCLDLEFLNTFLMGFYIMGESHPVEILTEDNKSEVMSRLVASYCFILQAKKEMKGLKELEGVKNLDFVFNTKCSYTFVDKSCNVVDALSFGDLVKYLNDNKIIME